jgi:hypothetical protein
MPGILMNGTIPTFYKIPVTTNLVYNIMQGTYPSEPTIVSVHCLDLPSPQSCNMKPLDNRKRVICSFEAFKPIIGVKILRDLETHDVCQGICVGKGSVVQRFEVMMRL